MPKSPRSGDPSLAPAHERAPGPGGPGPRQSVRVRGCQKPARGGAQYPATGPVVCPPSGVIFPRGRAAAGGGAAAPWHLAAHGGRGLLEGSPTHECQARAIP